MIACTVTLTDRPGDSRFSVTCPDAYPSLAWALESWSPFAFHAPGNSRNMSHAEAAREIAHVANR